MKVGVIRWTENITCTKVKVQTRVHPCSKNAKKCKRNFGKLPSPKCITVQLVKVIIMSRSNQEMYTFGMEDKSFLITSE